MTGEKRGGQKAIAKAMIPGVVVAAIFLVLFASMISPAPAAQQPKSAGVSASVASLAPVTLSTGINTSGIFNSLWQLVLDMIHSLWNDFNGLISTIFGGFGASVSTMFSDWSQSLYGLGIWAPVVFVVVLALAGFMIYLFLDLYGVEHDILSGEEDI